jgi:CheY-like chemotaxis protein
VKAFKTILLADDDENDVFFWKRLLAKTGDFCIQVVHDGASAIRYLAGEGEFADRHRFPLPSCLILDLKLPQCDGLEILEWMSAHIDCAQIQTVICSGSEHPGDREWAHKLGACSFLSKPPDPRHVGRLLGVAASVS